MKIRDESCVRGSSGACLCAAWSWIMRNLQNCAVLNVAQRSKVHEGIFVAPLRVHQYAAQTHDARTR